MQNQSESPNRTFELVKILIDKCLLGIVLALVAFFLNRRLEEYKFQEAARAELTRQRFAVARELTRDAFMLRARHMHAIGAVDATIDIQLATMNARVEAANALLATSEYARLLFPAPAVNAFRDYHNSVVNAPLADLATPDAALLDTDAALHIAVSSAAAFLTNPGKESNVTLNDRAVLPMDTASTPCIVPVATTGSATSIAATSAILTGITVGRARDAWFHFGTTPTMGFAIHKTSGKYVASGLLPGRTYFYQYAVQNACGGTRGTIRSFTTLAR